MKHQNISVTGSLNLNGVGVATSSTLNAFTASSDTKVNALIANTGSYATTGSNTFTGSQIIQGTLTAQTLVVQTVTSSVLYTTGSNIIGSSLSNIQQITGSVGITGSLTLNGAASISGSLTAYTNIEVGLTGTNYILWNTQGGIKLGRANIGPEDSLTSRWTGTLAYVDIASSTQWNGGVTILPNGGNVGIGTSSPIFALDVASTSADSFRINRTGVAGTGSASSMSFQVTQSNGQSATLGSISGEFMSNWGGDLRFYTKPANGTPNDSVTERMRIAANGNTSIAGDLALTPTNSALIFSSGFARIFMGSTEAMRITSGGNILMGTSTDSGYKLDVTGTARLTGALTGTSATFSSSVTATSFGTASGNTGSIATNTFVTIFTLSGGTRMYLLRATLPSGSGDANNYTAFATIIWDNNAARIVANNGGNLLIQLSGSNVQVKQNSGATSATGVNWAYLAI